MSDNFFRVISWKGYYYNYYIINKCHGKRIQKVYKIPNISNTLTEIFSFKLLFGLYILKASENKIKRINFKKRFYFIYHLNKSDIRNAQCN